MKRRRPVLTEQKLIDVLKNGEANDDELKEAIDYIAEGIEKETIHPRVGSKLESVIKEYHNKRRQTPQNRKSQIELLNKKLGECSTKLKLLVDGSMKSKPGDEIYITAIKAHAPMIIWSFHDLGVDLEKVQRLINPKEAIGDK